MQAISKVDNKQIIKQNYNNQRNITAQNSKKQMAIKKNNQ